MKFKIASSYSPAGDQPRAIAELVQGLKNGEKHQTLLGVTGSGKTFTMANVIEKLQLPTLIISHNKTLAAQLYEEFKAFFPDNAVEYFVSFYDYYQPEAYIPSSDTYIEKTADINDDIDRLRLKATSSLLSRKDVIVVASVSCIYNIGSSDSFGSSRLALTVGEQIEQSDLLMRLIRMQYSRNDMQLCRGTFRVRGDTVEIYPAYDDTGLRLQFFGDELENIQRFSLENNRTLETLDRTVLFPAKHYIASRKTLEMAVEDIRTELYQQVELFKASSKLVEAQRLEQRTLYDIEMLREVGYVSGIENYSRIFDGRPPGSKPYSLVDYFQAPFLTIIDESHASIPQIRGMYNGDHARKQTLVDHGFRIPAALDNRPLKFDEFEGLLDSVIYASATPGDYELDKSQGIIIEQIIRPTGLVDPPIEVRPATNQVDDLIEALRDVVAQGARALVTTLTKKMSEDLTEYLTKLDFKVRYLHSEIDTLQRPQILNELRSGECDIIVGINLLREGLDLPEVSLVAILDADKEGFLRSTRSIIQIAGRAARNIDGRIILYADRQTESIRKTISECSRRRKLQLQYNAKHGIIPASTRRKIAEPLIGTPQGNLPGNKRKVAEKRASYGNGQKGKKSIRELEKQMNRAAQNLEFEKAARIRDEIHRLRGNSDD